MVLGKKHRRRGAPGKAAAAVRYRGMDTRARTMVSACAVRRARRRDLSVQGIGAIRHGPGLRNRRRGGIHPRQACRDRGVRAPLSAHRACNHSVPLGAPDARRVPQGPSLRPRLAQRSAGVPARTRAGTAQLAAHQASLSGSVSAAATAPRGRRTRLSLESEAWKRRHTGASWPSWRARRHSPAMEARREAQAAENVLKVTTNRGCAARRPNDYGRGSARSQPTCLKFSSNTRRVASSPAGSTQITSGVTYARRKPRYLPASL
jgi:hypothetical protein